jgi:hypothetical protein
MALTRPAYVTDANAVPTPITAIYVGQADGTGIEHQLGLAEGSGGVVDPGTLNYFWGGRITAGFYQSNYGSTDTSSAPWSGHDGIAPFASSNWGLFLKHTTSTSGTTIGKGVSYIQWGNGVFAAWPTGRDGSNTFYTGIDGYCKAEGAFSQFDYGLRSGGATQGPIWEILNNTATAKRNLGLLFTDMKSVARPILHRPWWEMNGNWYSWGRDQNATSGNHGFSPQLGTTLAQRQANYKILWKNYRQICADVMRPGGVAGDGLGTDTGNVTFFWCPNNFVAGGSVPDPTPWFPGVAYVDVIGWDGYQTSTSVYNSPSTLYNPIYNALAALPGADALPMAIGEFGVAQNTPSPYKEGWFNTFFQDWLPAHPRVRMFNYFNDNGTNNDNPFIESGRAAAPDAARLAWVNNILSPTVKGAPTTTWGTTYNGRKLPLP